MDCENSNKKKYLILIVVTIISISISYSSNVKFYNINTLYGISMREANAICKDNNGFIWVSSKTGILRLTEDDYRIYQLPYETLNSINVKLVYKNSVLLAYTNNGQIFFYNRLRDRFEFLMNLRRTFKNNNLSINTVLIDETNTFWIATSGGLYKYQKRQLSLLGNDVSAISYATWYNAHKIIIAKRNEFSILDIQTQRSVFIYKNKTLPPNTFISKLFLDKSLDRLWVGTISNGLFYYDFK